MSKFTVSQQVQIDYYMDKIQRAWVNREKEYAKELEEKLYSLKQEFKKENDK